MSEDKLPEEAIPMRRELPVKIVRSPELALMFSNHVQVSFGQKSEVQLYFGQVLTPPPAPEPPAEMVVKQDIAIALTLDEATKLKELLDRLIPVFWNIVSDGSRYQSDDKDQK